MYNPNGIFSHDFDNEFSELLSGLQSTSSKHLILGDFNFHLNKSGDINANKFKSLLDQHNLAQHVDEPTHIAGNTLDLVITSRDLNVNDVRTDHSITSDHFSVLFSLTIPSPGSVRKTITYRKWKSIDVNQVREDIS